MREYFKKLYIVLWIVVFSIGVILYKWWFTHWTQGLDLAGGVRLLYLMDFSQYKQNFKNEAEFNQQRNQVVNIVEKNIDSRISKLGVSDYSARHVVLWGKDYMEVEIGGIKDVEYAKKMIGKTVQMTFKVPFEWEVI